MPGLKVLFVDDDSDESYLFNEAVEHASLNISLVHANDGNHLMSVLKTETAPDLVLMDINMPHKDGIEALAEIRKQPEFNALPVVIYSNTKNQDRINSCYEKGAAFFVIKPDDFEGMVEVVKKVFDTDWQNFRKPAKEDFVISVKEYYTPKTTA